MASKIYISAPMSIAWSSVQSVIDEIKERTGEYPSYWERSSKYNVYDLINADHVVFILPMQAFKAKSKDLPIGVSRELEKAVIYNKKVYVVYKPSYARNPLIYDADSDGYNIKGLEKTAGMLFSRVKHHEILRFTAQGHMLYSPYNSETISVNPCSEIPLPEMRQVYATTIPNPDYQDIRLLLMM